MQILHVLQPNKHRVCARTGSTGAGGKHPHTVYSHCNERMLLIMKKEDGSSLRRTHPHITRSVKKGLVVIVASPCMRTVTSKSHFSDKTDIKSNSKPHRHTLTSTLALKRVILSARPCVRRPLHAL